MYRIHIILAIQTFEERILWIQHLTQCKINLNKELGNIVIIRLILDILKS